MTDVNSRQLRPEGLSFSVLAILVTILSTLIYSILTRERPLSGFPLVAIKGKSPKESWLYHARQLIIEGTQKVGKENSWI